MNRREQQAEAERSRRRAVELGESGDPDAIEELLDLSHHMRPTVRRAAAPALGKLADWLSAHEIGYRYDDKFQIIQGYSVRPDFHLPQFDVYIESWGLDTTDYRIGMMMKKKLYQQEGKRLISLYPVDLGQLDRKLASALEAFGFRARASVLRSGSGHAAP